VRPRALPLFVLSALIIICVCVGTALADGFAGAGDVVAKGGEVWTTTRTGVVGVQAGSGQRAWRVRTGSDGTRVAAGDGLVWQLARRQLIAIDPRARRVRRRIRLHQAAFALAAGYGAVWLPSVATDALRRFDARTGRHRWSVKVGHSPTAVAVGAGSVWVASLGSWHPGKGGVVVNDGPGVVTRVDPATGSVLARIDVGRGATAVAVGAGAVWALGGRGVRSADVLDRIDPSTNRVVDAIRVPRFPAAVAAGRRYVWVVSEPRSAGGVLTRINVRSGRVMSRRIPHSWVPAGVTVAGGRVWIADPGVAQLIAVDPRTLHVTKRIAFSPS
jgi:hypothetical protein